MIKLNQVEKTYIIMCLIFSIIVSTCYIIVKINFKNASIISIFFAWIFLICFIYQPFLISLDYVIGLHITNNNHIRNLEIDKFLTYEYKIVGWIGTFFSNIVLPIYKDYILSGYFTTHQKLCDAIKRRLKKIGIILIILVVYVIFGLILFIIKGKNGYIIAKEFLNLILDCLIIPNFFKALWYIGAYYPLFIVKYEIILGNEKRIKEEIGIIIYYLNKDKNKIIKGYYDLKYIIAKYFIENTEINKKEYIFSLIKIVEKEKDKLKIDLNIMKKEDFEIRINFTNFHHILASSIRNIKINLYKIPRKLILLENIGKDMINLDKKHRLIKFIFDIYLTILLFNILPFFIILIIYFKNFNISNISNSMYKDYFRILPISFFYFLTVFFGVINKNSLTEQMIYGKFNSDTMCLLEFASHISGLITPLSFLTLDKLYIGIFNKYRKNIIFLRNFNIPIVETIFVNSTFQDVYPIYVLIKSVIILLSLILSFLYHSIIIKGCCKCKNKKIKFKINDKIDNCCCNKYYFTYYSSERFLNTN